MEGKNELIKRNESPIKLIDIKSNFKKVNKITPSKEVAEYGKKKKSVVFLDPPKVLKSPNIKKTQIIKTPHHTIHNNNQKNKNTPNFNTVIGHHSKRRKSKINLKSYKIKSDRNHSFKKMASLKTKVVNINKHYFIPIITQLDTSTFISHKNDNKTSSKKNVSIYKRVNTLNKNIRQIDNFNNNFIKKIEIKTNKRKGSDKNRKYLEDKDDKDIEYKEDKEYKDEKRDKDEKEDKISLIDKILSDNENSNYGIKLKKSKTLNKVDKFSNNSEINENNKVDNKVEKVINGEKSEKSEIEEKQINTEKSEKDENNEDIKNEEKKSDNDDNDNDKNDENNKNYIENEISNEDKSNDYNNIKNIIKEENKINDENNDNITNKVNIHVKNNSVDETKKKGKKKRNDNIIKKLLCCLYGS